MEQDQMTDSTLGANLANEMEIDQTPSRFVGQNDKDWSLPTPLDLLLKDKLDSVQWLKSLIEDYKANNISLDNILVEIPPECGWVRGALPQFKNFAAEKCLLALGFCPQYGEIIPAEGIGSVAPAPEVCFTDIVAGSVGRLFGPTISLCVRKDCRKTKKLERGSKSYRACLPIGQTESLLCLLATRLEIEIARKDFNIHFTGCIAFSSAAQDIAIFLDMKIWNIPDPSIIGRASCLTMWLAKLGLQDLAKQLSTIDDRDIGGVYEVLREDIIKGRPKMSGLGTWEGEAVLADERFLRRRAITEGLETNIVPRNKRKQGPVLTGPLTKKQLQNRENKKTQAYKDSQKRYEQTERGKEGRLKRSRKSYRKVKASWEEEKKLLDEGKE